MIIPNNRSVTWKGNVGVSGGIPIRSTIYTTLTNIDNTGQTHVHTQIQAALNSCPAGQVVLLPAGIFRLGDRVYLPSNVTLRGSGPNVTKLVANIGGDIIQFYGAQWRTTTTNILSTTLVKGTSTLVVSSSKDMDVGTKIQITQLNDSYVKSGIEGDGGSWSMGQRVNITSLTPSTTGSIISFSPSLYTDYNSTLAPICRWNVNGASGQWAYNDVVYAGVEDMSILNEYAYATAIVSFHFASYCWVKNVTTENAAISHYWLFDSLGCEIRDGHIKNIIDPVTSSRGYAVYLGSPSSGLPSNKTSGFLLENMIIEGTRGGPQLGYGASGCVYGYNFLVNMRNESAGTQKADTVVHSSFPIMNLVEGNQGIKFVADNFHGNGMYQTLFRNEWRGRQTDKTSNLGSVEVDTNHLNYNVVGNILGYSTLVSEVLAMTSPTGTVNYSMEAPAPFNYAHTYNAYLLGYDGEGGGTSNYTLEVAQTLIRHGNYDYVTNTVQWDPNIPDQVIPESLYLESKPSWWPVNKPWPCIGPDVSPMVTNNPAKDRYLSLNSSTSTTTPPPVTTSTTTTTTPPPITTSTTSTTSTTTPPPVVTTSTTTTTTKKPRRNGPPWK